MPTVEKSETKKPRTQRGFPGHVTAERTHDIILAEQATAIKLSKQVQYNPIKLTNTMILFNYLTNKSNQA